MQRTLVEKIDKLLLSFPEVEFDVQANTGSRYYRIQGDTYIRLANHIRTTGNKASYINIIISGDNFCVFYGNKLIDIPNIFRLKRWLKNIIPVVNTLKNTITGSDEKAIEEERNTEILQVRPNYNPNNVIDITGLTPRQKNQLVTQICGWKEQNQKSNCRKNKQI